MPTYEYACQKCGHTFEKFQPMKDEPLKKCPKCKRLTLKRLVGEGAGLIFKGSGFYITDYARKRTPGSEGSSPKSESSASKSEGSAPKSEGPASKGGDASKPAPSKPETPSSK